MLSAHVAVAQPASSYSQNKNKRLLRPRCQKLLHDWLVYSAEILMNVLFAYSPKPEFTTYKINLMSRISHYNVNRMFK